MTSYQRITRNGIVRQEKVIETPEGVISFTRPDDMYLGLKRWHVDFHVTQPDGREYWGTVWTDGRARIYGRRGSHGYQVSESHLKPLRATLAKLAPPLIAAERMDRRTALATPTSEPETITVKMTWAATMPMLIALLENGTEEGKQQARAELMELATKLDKACGQ